jgi:hypothetical protein
VHVDQIERDASEFAVLILPNLAALTDGQAATVRQFVERGGSLLATGESSLRNEWGEARPDFALGDLFGAHTPEKQAEDGIRRKWARETQHTYLRLASGSNSPKTSLSGAARHPVLKGFEKTNGPFHDLAMVTWQYPPFQIFSASVETLICAALRTTEPSS